MWLLPYPLWTLVLAKVPSVMQSLHLAVDTGAALASAIVGNGQSSTSDAVLQMAVETGIALVSVGICVNCGLISAPHYVPLYVTFLMSSSLSM